MSEKFDFIKPSAITDATASNVTPTTSASTTNTDTTVELSSIEGYNKFLSKHKKKGTYTRLSSEKTHAEVIDEETSEVIAVVIGDALEYIKNMS